MFWQDSLIATPGSCSSLRNLVGSCFSERTANSIKDSSFFQLSAAADLILGGLGYFFSPKYRLLTVHNDRLHSKVVRPMMSCAITNGTVLSFSLTILYIEALASSMEIWPFNIIIHSCTIIFHCMVCSLAWLLYTDEHTCLFSMKFNFQWLHNDSTIQCSDRHTDGCQCETEAFCCHLYI